MLRLYCRVSTIGTDAANSVVNVPLELITLLEHAESAPIKSKDGVIELIQFFADEARPKDVLEALARWCSPSNTNSGLYPVFQTILKQGAQINAMTETSGSLHRVMLAHSRFEETVESLRVVESNFANEPTEDLPGSLWTRLSHGTLVLDK